jgi:ferredoxin
MTYVITDACVGVKDNSCTEVCPVDCIHPTPGEQGYDESDQVYIDPGECIECDACVVACPVDAPMHEDQLEPDQQHLLGINAEFYRAATAT